MRKKRGLNMKKIQNIFLYSVFLFFIVFLLNQILFKYISPIQLFDTNRYFARSLNTVPFREIMRQGSASEINLYGNIILFFPLGVYIQLFMKKKSIFKALFLCFITSFILEVLQYLFGLGASDIDDVILNSFGGLLGIISYRIVLLVTRNEKKVKSFVTWSGAIVAIPVLAIITILYMNN